MSTFQVPPTFAAPIVTDEQGNAQFNPIWLRWFLDVAAEFGTVGSTTGTGKYVLQDSPTINSPTLTTPALGTPSSGNLVNCTGYDVIGQAMILDLIDIAN